MSEPITLTMEQLDELLTSAVKKALEPMTQVDRKHGVFPGTTEEDLQKLSKEERMLKFFKAVWFGNKEEAVKLSGKALTEGTGSAGGYLVPDEFASEVLRVAGQYGLARRLCRVVPMTRDKMNFPAAGATGVSVSWPNEAAQIAESTPNFGQVVLDTKKCAGITALSNELVADADVNVLDYLITLFGEAIAKEEDKQWLTGTGSPITGLLGHASVNVVTMGTGDTAFSNIHTDDLIDLIDAVDDFTESNGAFFFHKNILAHLRKLKDSNGQYIWQPPSAGNPGTILGYPYYTTPVMPDNSQSGVSTKFVAFGDGRYTLFGDRAQLSIAVATEGTVGANNLFEQDMQALRVIERVDIQVAIPGAYAVLQTAAA